MVLNDPIEFTLSTTGSATGQQYTGKFKVKALLSHREKLRKDEIRRQLLGQNQVDVNLQTDDETKSAVQTARIFANIWPHLIDAPSWWKEANNGLDLLDEEPVMEVCEKILDLQRAALDAIKTAGDVAKTELAK